MSKQESLTNLLQSGSWNQATLRAQSHPHECTSSHSPSYGLAIRGGRPTPALALACRLAAPLSCTRAILQACPQAVRSGGGLARGTPLHEAISNPRVSLDVISLLIETDEALEVKQALKDIRAAQIRDVDGQIPLHLLVRRYFCFHPQDEKQKMIETLKLLISSCPQACGMPDRRDFEETPLVLALKANMYAHYDTALLAAYKKKSAQNFESDNEYDCDEQECEPLSLIALLEEKIHIIINLMLRIYPASASNAAPNLKFTPLHSAVYHGRCKEIIRNLLLAGQSSTLCANEGRLETPLHFAAMRGESEAVIAALVNTHSNDNDNSCLSRSRNQREISTCLGRKAVNMLDHRGLTPLHWLWIRLLKEYDSISSLISDKKVKCKEKIKLQHYNQSINDQLKLKLQFHLIKMINQESNPQYNSHLMNSLADSQVFDKTYFYAMKKLDTPLDFRQMRHLPTEYDLIDPACAKATLFILERIFSKSAMNVQTGEYPSKQSLIKDLHSYEKVEIMIILFWMKVECMLKAAAQDELINNNANVTQSFDRPFFLVHAAASLKCCPPSLLFISLSLRPEQLSMTDHLGNLPLHYAASRPTHCWEISSSNQNSFQNQNSHFTSSENPNSLHSTSEGFLEDDTSVDNDSGQCPYFTTFEFGESLIMEESSLPLVLSHSCPKASRTYNHKFQLPLHIAINNIINGYASFSTSPPPPSSPMHHYYQKQSCRPLAYLEPLIKSFPEALQRRDGVTKLYPFMQAAATATDAMTKKKQSYDSSSSSTSTLYSSSTQRQQKVHMDELESKFTLFSLNITFGLLRENPILVHLDKKSYSEQTNINERQNSNDQNREYSMTTNITDSSNKKNAIDGGGNRGFEIRETKRIRMN